MKKFRYFLLAESILLFLSIVSGNITRSAEFARTCAKWFACLPQFMLVGGAQVSANLTHGLLTVITGLGLVVLFIYGWTIRKNDASLMLGIGSAILVYGIQAGLGLVLASTIDSHFSTALHLMLALLLETIIIYLVICSFMPGFSLRRVFKHRTTQQILYMLGWGLVFLMLISGTLVASLDNAGWCEELPLCAGWSYPETIQNIHRLLVFLSSIVVVGGAIYAWKKLYDDPPVLVSTTIAAVMFVSQGLLGAAEVQGGFPAYLAVIHAATAIGVWIAGIISVFILNGKKEPTRNKLVPKPKATWRDYLMLTKPIVVALLLVTTYAGMIIGGRKVPAMDLTLWVLVGGFLAAGGSSAINQYLDREDDAKMQRTSKRPIPSGRITPAQGMAFGSGLALASFYVMLAFTNWIAALLTLAGIIYYVLLYSVFLKKTTVQNIVIGGGAGAIPPLVGWAAVTGGLNIPSLLLFAVVFMWTPPHFWALAIVRKKDYARAGVPMLPVVRGEHETRKQILIYTIELVVLTLVLPLFGLGGAVYLVLATILGGSLIYSAWKVWRTRGNKVAWRLYRHSSMYLALIFFALVVDILL